MIFTKSDLQQVYCPQLSTPNPSKKSIDKTAKLLDMLDKQIKEENCRHSPNDLFEAYIPIKFHNFRIYRTAS